MGDNELEFGFEVGTPGLSPISAKIALRYKTRWGRRSEEYLEAVVTASGMTANELSATIQQDERLDDLVLQAGERASRVSDPTYRSTLALAVAAAIADDARIDEVEHLVNQLVSLDAVTLRIFRRAYGSHSAHSIEPTSKVDVRLVADDLGISRAVVESAFSRLAGVGLLQGRRSDESIGRALADGHGTGMFGFEQTWITTAWGVRAVALCVAQIGGNHEDE